MITLSVLLLATIFLACFGSGLVSDELAASPQFVLAVFAGARTF